MYTIKPLVSLKKEINVPPDKSISHRAVMLSAICKANTLIKPFLNSDDTMATLECFSRIGVKTWLKGDELTVEGAGMYIPCDNLAKLYARESGTTIRILSGILCAQKFPVLFEASPSLERRPMGRITVPLRKMGADIQGKSKDSKEYPPLTILPVKKLHGMKYEMHVSSAQVKSAIMLAGLYAAEATTIRESFQSRDHTERMLKLFKGKVRVKGNSIYCYPVKKLVSPGEVFIPSDFSSAAFFIALGLVLRNTEIRIKNVNVNPSRCGLLKVLKRMGANLKIVNSRRGYEPFADIIVKSSKLKSTEVKPAEVALMIDEIPILCVLSSFAEGITRIWGVEELAVKETNRAASMVFNLKQAGVQIKSVRKSLKSKGPAVMGLSVTGRKKFVPAHFKSFGDHRTAMSMIIFALASNNGCSIDDVRCINKSFPDFIRLVDSFV